MCGSGMCYHKSGPHVAGSLCILGQVTTYLPASACPCEEWEDFPFMNSEAK